MKSCSLIVLAVAFSFSAVAQYADVRGVVSDSLTGERIPYANVVIVGTSKGAAANAVGFYLVPRVSPGSYQITASAVGYARRTRNIIVPASGAVEVNFRLPSSAVETEEVVVSGVGHPELLEINTSVHVLDQKDLKLNPVAAQPDVFHSLKILPGIVSTSDVSSKFYVRGGAGDQNLVFLDGMRIYNPFHALGVFSVFDPDIVRTVEIYTGAFPAGFGGRLSSVVNMMTRDGRTDRPFARAQLNFLSSKLQVEGPLYPGASVFVNARKSLFTETFGRMLNEDIPLSFYDVFAKLSGEHESGGKYDATVLLTGDELLSRSSDEPNYRWKNQSFGVTFSGLLSDRLFVSSTTAFSIFQLTRDTKGSPLLTPASSSVKEPSVRAMAMYYTDRQDVYQFGFEFGFPNLEYRLVNTLGEPLRLYSISPEASLWIGYQAKRDELQIAGGLHTEVGQMFNRGVKAYYLQPRIHVSYRWLSNWRGKISYGRFTQNVITVSNEDDIISIFDAWIKVPSYLEPEQADHYVVGLDGNIIEALSLNIQAYYKLFNSLVAYNRDKVDAFDPDYVNGTGKAYGAELSLRYGISRFDLFGSYSLGWTSLNNRGFEYVPRYDRRHHVNLLGMYSPIDGLDVSARWEYGSGFPFTPTIGYFDRLKLQGTLPGPFERETGEPYALLGAKNSSRLPAYHRLDLSVAYRFSITNLLKGGAGLHLLNLYNSKNIFYFDRKTGRRVNMLPFFPSATVSIEY